MPLTEDHFVRISAFVHARLDEVFVDLAHRQREDGGEGRVLRALRSTVFSLTATRDFLKRSEQRHQVAALIAWNELSAIAEQWNDHPDHHADFGKTADDMAGLAATAAPNAKEG